MTAASWVSVTLVVAAYGWIAVELFRERRVVDELHARLDEADRDADELRVYVSHLAEYVTGLEERRPVTGRHAHTGELRAAA